VRARGIFNRKYENNEILWTGNFVEAKPAGSLSGLQILVGTDHKLNIHVKMSPSESVIHPDLVLSVGSNLFE
jgi:hypothetical protein